MKTKFLASILGLAVMVSVGCGGGASNSTNNANIASNKIANLPENANVNLQEMLNRTPTPDPSVSPLPSDELIGQWPGTDEYFLSLDRKGDKYWITIKGIEGIEMFEGTGKGKTVEFKRKNKIETIRKATPEETGMKWPEGVTDCIVLTKGSEAYCKQK